MTTLLRFCESPPESVTCVVDGPSLGVSQDCTRIVFYNEAFLREGVERVLADGAARIVVDGTYKTNVQRLVLVGLGGLCLLNDGGHIRNRWVPWLFCLTHSEDEVAYRVVLEQFLAYGTQHYHIDMAPLIKDCYVDGMGGAENAL